MLCQARDVDVGSRNSEQRQTSGSIVNKVAGSIETSCSDPDGIASGLELNAAVGSKVHGGSKMTGDVTATRWLYNTVTQP